jgi:polyhydroxyalkanoate synthase subunit PhaE
MAGERARATDEENTMSDASQQEKDISRLMQSWADSALQFWKSAGVGQGKGGESGGFSFPFTSAETGAEGEEKFRSYRNWETALNNLTSLWQLMAAPQNQEATLKSAGTFAESLLQAAGESLENFTEFQNQLVRSAAKLQEHSTTCNFEDLDHGTFESFRELYRSEIQKYLFIPKLGLPREFHEQLSQLADRSTLFSSHLVELLYLFSVPFEKTNRMLQRQTKVNLEKGEFYTDAKQAYNDWVKVLEGNFMELLKSSEYTGVLNETINALAAYKKVKNDVIEVFTKDLQIPTNKEMDEVYRDLYQMKKTIRELSRKVTGLEAQLTAAQQAAAEPAGGEKMPQQPVPPPPSAEEDMPDQAVAVPQPLPRAKRATAGKQAAAPGSTAAAKKRAAGKQAATAKPRPSPAKNTTGSSQAAGKKSSTDREVKE